MSASMPRREAVEHLRTQLRSLRPSAVSQAVTPTGLGALDCLLPDGGIPSASVIEWISEHPGQAAASLALRTAAALLQRPGCLAVIDEQREFFPGAIEVQGIPLQRLLLVRIPPEPVVLSSAGRSRSVSASVTSGGQSLWALEQTCRCRGVRVVLAWLQRCTSAVVRRLQLAVESSGVVLMLLRPAQALQQPSFADLRLQVSALPASEDDLPAVGRAFRRIQVRLLRARQSVQSVGFAELRQDLTGRFPDLSQPR
ncbi:MAG: hypothetical protein RL215_2196 [Planctomycetota bacterium]